MRMTPKRAERTEHDYRYSTCRTAIGIYSRNEVRRPSYSQAVVTVATLGSLSSDVFERRTSTGSEVFSLLTCLDDIKFVFLSFFTVIEAIWLKICAKPPSKNEKRPLPVDVRRSKTLLLKLPTVLLEGDGRRPRDYSISQNVSNEGKYNEQVKTRHTRWTPRKPGGWYVCKMKKHK